MLIASGKYWVDWANEYAKNSHLIKDLAEPFRTNVTNFVCALKNAGANIHITSTRRSKKRAYLFHWCWKIALGKCKPSDPPKLNDVDIEWDHLDDRHSVDAAMEMVKGFQLLLPPQSYHAPSLNSHHVQGKAIDMNIVWHEDIEVKQNDGQVIKLPFMKNINDNLALHEVGASYGVLKLRNDAPHWSDDGH